jgi:hypothetical protein
MARFRGLDLQFPPRAQSFSKLQDVFFESLQMQHLKIPKKTFRGKKGTKNQDGYNIWISWQIHHAKVRDWAAEHGRIIL